MNNFADLAPFILVTKTDAELEDIIATAKTIIYSGPEISIAKHAGLILHYARHNQIERAKRAA